MEFSHFACWFFPGSPGLLLGDASLFWQAISDWINVFFQWVDDKDLFVFHACFLSVMLFAILFFWVRYRQNRHKEYLYYTLYLFLIWLYILRTKPEYLSFLISDEIFARFKDFLENPPCYLNRKTELIFSNTIQILYLLFIRQIFNYAHIAPLLYRFATFFIRFQTAALAVQVSVLGIVGAAIVGQSMTVLKLLFVAPVVYLLVKSYHLKIRVYRNVLFGSTALLFGAFIAAVLHTTHYGNNNIAFFQLGTLLEILYFNTALGEKEKLLYEEKRAVENKLSRQEKENDLLVLKKLESDFHVLKSQISPHFVSNCLNAIKQLVNEDKREEATLYLERLSELMRQVTICIVQPNITLEEELAISRLYLQMESLRFGEAFSWGIEIEDGLDASFIKVPPFILQPFLENAIWHGLLQKESERMLKITLENHPQTVKCVIDDNGIGRKRAGALQMSLLPKNKKSVGIANTKERLHIFRQLQKVSIELHIIDKHDEQGNATGTRVELILPT